MTFEFFGEGQAREQGCQVQLDRLFTEQGHLDRGKVEAEIQPACPSPSCLSVDMGDLLSNWHKVPCGLMVILRRPGRI